ncbi:hypothetical protein NE237_024501 [Protea cynaroides]|uniref:pectinesterase n=1 Tax=Protea cynaroides TaxID=273540 RepID=A0A9Q0H194_9MAGN|nr:hypothetical protein NE237_024501 [Protea cynaroides]
MWLIPPFIFTLTLIFTLFGTGKAVDCIPKVIAYTITVGKPGYGKFDRIQAAIDSIPSQNNRWIRIAVSPGLYSEKVTVPREKTCVILQGNSREDTVISWNAHSITNLSATFTSFADNFVAKNIAFKNTYTNGKSINGGSTIKQSLAVELVGDKSSFLECGFYAFQDTLWDVVGRHYFRNCYIQGAVDFIWGNGQSIYEKCVISVLPLPGGVGTGFITAQGRNSLNENSGFVFKGCNVLGIDDTTRTYLGRAYGAYSTVIWYKTQFSNVIVPQGWQAWHYVNQE